MYSVSSYGKMVADGPRLSAYVEALRNAIKPDSVVVDLGSGPGFFSLLACRFGARRVYAIEPDNAIELARRAAVANGFADQLVCLQDLSTNIDLPEPADVIISDLRGILPLFHQHIPAIVDARRRFLKRDGILIPQSDSLWAALITAPEAYDEMTSAWQNNRWDVDFSDGRQFVINSGTRIRCRPDQLLVEPVRWSVIDYQTVSSPDVESRMSWQISDSATAHGILIWFDTELAPGIGFSNHPSQPELVYGSAFFPFTEPVMLQNEDIVDLTIKADLVGDDYVWRWHTKVSSPKRRNPVVFKQSTFFSIPLSLSKLHKQAATFRPTANEKGMMTARALSLMDGKTSVEEIARILAESFPGRFADGYQALTTAARLSEEYSDD